MAGRSQERCEQAIAEIKQEVGQKAKIDFLELDLADMACALPPSCCLLTGPACLPDCPRLCAGPSRRRPPP